MGSSEEIAVGDDIIWWCEPGGHGIAPGDPARAVAYSVLLGTALGEWLATARPEHHPTRVDAAGESAG